MTNDELLQKTISYLRFPLIVAVVFIHNKMAEINIQGDVISYEDWPWLIHTMDFFSDVLPRIAVPLFFFISGFLFFYNNDFDITVYKKKLRTRYHTLVIPYLIWNFVGFLILLVQMHPKFLSLFPLLRDYRIDISEFFSYFWMKELPMDSAGEHSLPINYPFWFIRDLILLVVATPLIYWLIKRMKFIVVAIFGIVWFFSLGMHIGFPSISHQSIFFFPLGAYFSIYRINFVELANRAKWSPFLYIIFAIGDTFTKGEPFNYWIHHGGVLIGLIASVYFTSLLVKSEKVKTSKFLSNASFFVFAVHGLVLSKYMKALIMIFHPHSAFIVLFIDFYVPITTILIFLLLYKIIYKLSPPIAKTITGGR